jgi:hypothetical protein
MKRFRFPTREVQKMAMWMNPDRKSPHIKTRERLFQTISIDPERTYLGEP